MTPEQEGPRCPGCGSEARHYSATPTQCTDPFHDPAPEQEGCDCGEGPLLSGCPVHDLPDPEQEATRERGHGLTAHIAWYWDARGDDICPYPSSARFDNRADAVEWAEGMVAKPPRWLRWIKVFPKEAGEMYVCWRWENPEPEAVTPPPPPENPPPKPRPRGIRAWLRGWR